MVKEPLTTYAERTLAYMLRRVIWPTKTRELFDAILGVVPTDAFEVTVIVEGETPRVMLFPRPPDDTYWPNQLHGAGVVKIKGDTAPSALARLLQKELGGAGNVTEPVFVGVEHILQGDGPDQCLRGDETALIYYCVWQGDSLPTDAVLADPNKLPPNLMCFHRLLIARAMKRYWEDRKN